MDPTVPFILLDKTLRKIRLDGAEAVNVAPFWTTQSWFPELMGTLILSHIVIGSTKQQPQMSRLVRWSAKNAPSAGTYFDWMSVFRSIHQREGPSERATTLIAQSWRASIRKNPTSLASDTGPVFAWKGYWFPFTIGDSSTRLPGTLVSWQAFELHCNLCCKERVVISDTAGRAACWGTSTCAAAS